MNLYVAQGQVSPDVIDFGVGHPADDLLPLEIMRQAAEQRLGHGDPVLLQYGYEQGDGYFRMALADFLTRRYETPVDPDSLFVTNGVSQAIDLICTLYTKPGDTIIVEEPSYFLALRIFADHGLRVLSLPADEHGLRIDALEEVLFNHHPAFVYVIPTFQNPSGVTLTLERRRQLVELSQEYGFLILADEVYHLLSYGAPPPAPLATFSTSKTVLSLGSLSKILAPGLRLGWIQTAPSHVQRLMTSGMLDSGGGLNPFTSGIVHSVLAAGRQDSYQDRLRTIYGERVMALDAELQNQLGEEISYRRPDGGYFFWLELKRTLDSEQLLAAATAHKVSFRPGIRFSSRQGLRNHLRLSFAYYDNAGLVDGVTRLAAALVDCIAHT